MNFQKSDSTCSNLQNLDILKDLNKKLLHFDQSQRDELKMWILEYEQLYSGNPTSTDKFIMMLMLRVQNQWNKKIQYLLDNDFIEPC